MSGRKILVIIATAIAATIPAAPAFAIPTQTAYGLVLDTTLTCGDPQTATNSATFVLRNENAYPVTVEDFGSSTPLPGFNLPTMGPGQSVTVTATGLAPTHLF